MVAIAPASPASAVHLVGGHRIIGLLGDGGMCRVHRALDPDGRVVALKVLAPARCAVPGCVERFLAEARAMRAVHDPRVVAIHGAGRDGDLRWISMELMPGGDAVGLMRYGDGRLSWRVAVELVRDAALGIAALHRAGLIHRDLKPENLLLDAAGRATIADLGLACAADGVRIDGPAGRIVGTPAYLSPEQARGDADLDGRTDIHALGATLYALVTGRLPFDGADGREIIGRVRSEAFPEAQREVPGLPASVAALIRRCTERERERRPAHASQVVRACDELLAELPDERGPWFARLLRRRSPGERLMAG